MTESRDIVSLPYGKGALKLRIPAGRRRLVEFAEEGEPLPALDAFRAALNSPIASPPLEELARGRSVVFLLDDSTRSEPHEAFARAVLERLVGAAHVRCIIATGSHDRLTEGNRRITAGLESVARELHLPHTVSVHDCADADLHARLGTTRRGTPVEISRDALAADLIVITSDVKNHYFAGYSNPLKDILPGVSSFAAVERNHSLALEPDSTFGRHPWHPDPARRTNPVAEDMLEAVGMVTAQRDVFVLCAVTTSAGVVWAGAGAMEQVTREAIGRVDRIATVQVEPVPYLVVSPGGDPEDETLYNAQRGLELSRNGVRAGGEVLFVASCARGTAPTPKARAEFSERLAAPLEQVLAGLEDDYVLYSHKAFKFAQMIRSLRAIHMVTDLSAEQVAAIHMSKVEEPQQVVDRWLAESDGPVLVTTHANKIALYASRS
jgi:nickel-dependent lactate racemase